MKNTEILDYIKKSFELKNQGYFKPAIEMLYKALALDGDNIEILAQLAQLYRHLENYQRAIYYIEKVLEHDNKHLDCLFLLQEIYLTQGFLKLADDIAVKIHEIQPTAQHLAKRLNILNKLHNFDEVLEIEQSNIEFDDECLYEIAFAHYENYDMDGALAFLEKGLEKNNSNEKIMLLLGKIYYDKKETEKAKRIFTELEKTSKEPDVFNYLGLFKLDENNYMQAARLFSKAHKSNPLNPEYIYNLASSYFLNGWSDEALKYFSQAICLDPENVNYHYSLAYLYYQKKDYEKASIELNFIKTIEQNHKLSNILDALITAKKGDLLTAKNRLENIIKMEEADDFAHFAISEIYKELSQVESAKKALKSAIELNPNSLEYLGNLAELELGQKNYETAEEIAQKMLEINKKYLFAHVLIAKIYLEREEFENLYDTAQEIIKMDSNCAEGYYYNALSLFEQGDKDFAIESLKKAISLDLNNAQLYVKMSELYQDLGDYKNAYAWAQEASDIDERNYKYKWLCAKLAAAMKNTEDASKYYTQSYRLAAFDKELAQDYSNYLKSIGKEKQAKKIFA